MPASFLQALATVVTGGNTVSRTMTIGAGLKEAISILIGSDTGDLTVTGVAYTAGSGSAPALSGVSNPGNGRSGARYTSKPNAGVITITATFSGTITGSAAIGLIEYDGIDQAVVTNNPTDAGGAAQTISITSPGAGDIADSLLVDALGTAAISVGTQRFFVSLNHGFNGATNTGNPAVMTYTSAAGRCMLGGNMVADTGGGGGGGASATMFPLSLLGKMGGRPVFTPSGASSVIGGGGSFEVDGITELPRITYDVAVPAVTGTSRPCNNDADVTAALAAAVRGDELVLANQGTFNFARWTIPVKAGIGWITIRSAGSGSLPVHPNRIRDGTDNANMAKITASGSPCFAIDCAAGASGFYFIGIQFLCPASPFSTGLVKLGNGETTFASLAHDFVFNRCIFKGDATIGCRRGLAGNAYNVGTVGCQFFGFRESGGESQAVGTWNGYTHHHFNSYFEGASENIMYGGADPTINSLVCTDIVYQYCHFKKPIAWVGTGFNFKNLFEVKNGKRVKIYRCTFENTWQDAQRGLALNLKPVNQDGGAAWCAAEDISIIECTFINVACGLGVVGISDQPALFGKRIVFRNNVMQISAVTGTENQFMVFLLDGPDYVTVQDNTILRVSGTTGATVLWDNSGTGRTCAGFVYKNNITDKCAAGVKGNDATEGSGSLTAHAPGAVFKNNAITGASAIDYPANGNIFPVDHAALQLTNYAAFVWTVTVGSPCHNTADDGSDMGGDAANDATFSAQAIAGTGF